MFERSDNIPLIKPFLLNVQTQNNKVVNSAINDLLIEEEDYKTLRDSVENYDNYDPVELAQRLEKHEYVTIQSSDQFYPCAQELTATADSSSSGRLQQTSTGSTNAGTNQLRCRNKISFSRTLSKLPPSPAGRRLSMSFCDT
jgi:hypothetical protein